MSSDQHGYYKKWLRYYLDFCGKYRLQSISLNTPARFLTKLRAKEQSEWQLKQAAHAVSLYLESVKAGPAPGVGKEKQEATGTADAPRVQSPYRIAGHGEEPAGSSPGR